VEKQPPGTPGLEVSMKLRFDVNVRASFARELKIGAWILSGGGMIAGAFESQLTEAAISAVLWGVLQALAHILLAYRDDK
jgi:hypothetical protein